MRSPSRTAGLALVVAIALVTAACGGGEETSSERASGNPGGRASGDEAVLALGAEVYAASCAECHGSDLRGTDKGPSHLSKVYEPGHHPDGAFVAAIRNGSRQHHWSFGDMPPVPGLTDDEIEAVIAYVRSQQQTEGFEPYPPS